MRGTDGEIIDAAQALRHVYSVECDKCGFAVDAETSEVLHENQPGRPRAAVNVAAVAAGESCGVRRAQQEHLFTAMGIMSISKDSTYSNLSKTVHVALADLAYESILENIVALRAHLLEQGAEPDEYGRVPFMASADGSWPVQGYSSSHGQASLFFGDDTFSSKPIAQSFRGKYCALCTYYDTKLPTYCKPPHGCCKNWEGRGCALTPFRPPSISAPQPPSLSHRFQGLLSRFAGDSTRALHRGSAKAM